MDLATLGIRVDANGSIQALSAFSSAADRASHSGSSVERMAARLRSALVAMGLAISAHQVVEYADSWNLVEARIGLVTSSTRQQALVQGELFAAAQRTRTDFENLSDLYTKTARNLGSSLTGSQRDVLDFTETVSKGFIVSGASANEAASGVLQLGQALQSGVLQGDELRSIRENAPMLFRALQEGLHMTGGEIKKAGAAGELTSQRVFQAILDYSGKVDEQFQKMPVTIGQSFTVLENELRRFVGNADHTYDASRKIGLGISFIAEHLNTLANIVGYGVLVWGSYNAVLKVSAAVSTVTLAVQNALAVGEAALTARVVAANEAVVLAKTQVAEASAAATSAVLVGSSAAAAAEAAAAAASEALAVAELEAAAASAALAAGETAAAGAAALLSAGMSALWTAITGPAGIAIALATVIALLVSYRSASERAKEATDAFSASLYGMSKTQLLVTEAELDTNIEQTKREMELLRQQHRDTQEVLQNTETLGTSGLPVKRYVTVDSDDMARLRSQLEIYQMQSDALEERKQQMAELDIVIQGNAKANDDLTRAERARLRAMAEFRAMLAAMLRDAQQELDQAGLQGMAQREQAIRYQAVNDLLQMRADLQEKVISKTISQRDADVLAAEATRAVARAMELRIEALNRQATLEARQRAEDSTRDREQQVELTTRYGMAQEALRIHFVAVNDAIRARRELTGEALDITLQSIEAEETFGQRMLYVQRIAEDLQRTFSDTFERILNDGLKSFGDLFSGIKQMFIRFLVEMETDRLMKLFADKFGGILNSVLSGVGAGKTGSAPVSAGAGLAAWAAGFEGHREYNLGGNRDIGLEGITATATSGAARQREMMKKFAGYLGAAMIGASLGQMFGYSSGSATVGALAGGLSGAAAGFAMGGPVGGIIGGLAGLASGIFGAHKKQQEMERLRNDVTNKNTATINALRESINGSPLLSGKNLANFNTLARALSGGAAGTDFRGGGIQAILAAVKNTSELSKALKGGESSSDLKKIEQQFGISFQELGRAAQALGIELFDANGKLVRTALNQLAQALELSIKAATQFGNNLDDIQKRQQARNALFNLDTPQQKLDDTYEVLQKLAPDLLKQMGLANLNLDTEAGRNVLLQGLRDIFNLIDSGKLTPELLGSFKDKGELIDAILAAKEGLDAFKNTLGDVSTDFPKAMDLVIYEQRRGRGAQSSPANVTPPAKPTDVGGNTGSNPSSGGVTVQGSVFGGVTIIAQGGESGEELLRRLEDAATNRYGRGGVLFLPGVVTEAR